MTVDVREVTGWESYVNDEPGDPNPGIMLDQIDRLGRAMSPQEARALAAELMDRADYFDSLGRGVRVEEKFWQGAVRETRTHVIDSLEPVAVATIVGQSVSAYRLGKLAGDLSRDGHGQLGWSDFRVVTA